MAGSLMGDAMFAPPRRPVHMDGSSRAFGTGGAVGLGGPAG
ncbi:hypothetical protein [Streptomyces sp. NPDC054854]